MHLKPYNYLRSSKQFLSKAWGHGKVLGAKLDGLIGQGAAMYGAVAPIVGEAAQRYGSAETQQALKTFHKGVGRHAERYQSIRDEAGRASELVDRLGSAIGGF